MIRKTIIVILIVTGASHASLEEAPDTLIYTEDSFEMVGCVPIDQ
jgi:hypothetical protein